MILLGWHRAEGVGPATSDINFLGDLEGVVDFDAEAANGAFDARVAQQELRRPKVGPTASPSGVRGEGKDAMG